MPSYAVNPVPEHAPWDRHQPPLDASRPVTLPPDVGVSSNPTLSGALSIAGRDALRASWDCPQSSETSPRSNGVKKKKGTEKKRRGKGEREGEREGDRRKRKRTTKRKRKKEREIERKRMRESERDKERERERERKKER